MKSPRSNSSLVETWRCALLFSVWSLLAGTSVNAQYTWDPDSGSSGIQGGSGTWSTSVANWTNDGGATHVVWPGSAPAVFAGNDGTYSVTVPSSLTLVSGITFNASGYTLEAPGAVTIGVTNNITLASGKSASVGNNVTIGRNSNYNITGGGALNINTGGRVQQGGAFSIGIDGSSVVVNGGELKVNNTATVLAVSNSGVLTINSGTVNAPSTSSNAVTNGLRFSSNGTVNLDGGILTTSRIFTAVAGTHNFNFNGGLLQASGTSFAGTDFMGGITSANVKEGGAKIDSNGVNITVSQALVHGGVAANDGGLTKSGAGVLTLTGTNTYTGSTTVSSGTLLLADNGRLGFVIGANGENNQINGAGTVTLDGDFAFDLTAAGTTVGNSWNIVDVGALTENFGSSFTVVGFAESSNVWTGTSGGATYEFAESSGVLTVVPEPSICVLLGVGLTTLLFGFNRSRSSVVS